ncbi:hypothetical protein TNIN_246071 [Trichonephila inaurata madagascariensis]|uniref:Uncharacterized protein n=1 Tax=Trichonephila inaurata madagascariensis TaxID=2747483 RepID=A0A8X6YHI5_9ARAC|nr:hypothetical protein TNIN_246071 [Trichonephila inaurata madagascariensis]
MYIYNSDESIAQTMAPPNTPEQALDLTIYKPPSEVYHPINTQEEEVYRPPSEVYRPETEELPHLPDLPDLPSRPVT